MGGKATKPEEKPSTPVVTKREEAQEAVVNKWEFKTVEIQYDDEGFTESFSLDQETEYMDYFDKYGFVVINNVLDPASCSESINEIWAILNQLRKQRRIGEDDDGNPLNPNNDPSLWEDQWPVGNMGIAGGEIAKGTQAWKNRINPNLYKIYSNLIGTKQLLVSCDRYGVMRPTTGLLIHGEKQDRPKWQTLESWFHWDLNPWFWTKTIKDPNFLSNTQRSQYKLDEMIMKYSIDNYASSMLITENNTNNEFLGFLKVQGLINLADSRQQDGGFQTIPGFHKYLAEWAGTNTKTGNGGFVAVPKVQEQEFKKEARKIAARAGSLIVWNSEMPHCNYPNSSDRFRYVQYIKMFPARVAPEFESKLGEARKGAMKRAIEGQLKEEELSRVQKKLLGLIPWKSVEKEEEEEEEEEEK